LQLPGETSYVLLRRLPRIRLQGRHPKARLAREYYGYDLRARRMQQAKYSLHVEAIHYTEISFV
jgi:hypothetical protein